MPEVDPEQYGRMKSRSSHSSSCVRSSRRSSRSRLGKMGCTSLSGVAWVAIAGRVVVVSK